MISGNIHPVRSFVHTRFMLWITVTIFLSFGMAWQANAEPVAGKTWNPEVIALEPAQVFRGMPVKISGKAFDQASEIRVRLNDKELLLEKPQGDDANSLTFRVPASFPLGKYTVRVVFFRNEQIHAIEGVPIPSQNHQIHVISDGIEKVKVSSIHPVVSYPMSGSYGFQILGEGFSLVPSDNQLILTGAGIINTDAGFINVTWVDSLPDKTQPQDKVYGRVINSHQLEISGLSQLKYYGRLKLQVRVGDNTSDSTWITFSRVSREVPWAVALAIVVLLSAMVYIPVTWSIRDYKIGAFRYRPWTIFLLDQDTETLSLSKFQLYLWTGVAIFGYIYLTVARSLVQGVFEFAPIPEGLPGILAVSAGTTALAVGITTIRGPKGSGEEQPSFADLITTGGVVVAERFQFLIWTVLGVLAFVFLVISSDPATIQDLPKVPEGFLYLMGISSAGYLGGKLARKSGPVIDTIVAQKGTAGAAGAAGAAGTTVTMEVQGRNLSRQSIIMIDDRQVTYDTSRAATSAPVVKKDATLEVIREDPQATQPDFALALRVILLNEIAWLEEWRKSDSNDDDANNPDNWLKRPHRFSIMNPDGQKAVLSFTIKG